MGHKDIVETTFTCLHVTLQETTFFNTCLLLLSTQQLYI